MDDLIKRADAIEAVLSVPMPLRLADEIDEVLRSLPSAELPKGDLISRSDAIAYIDRIINSGLGRNKSLDYIHKYISALPSADAVSREECDECKTDKEGVLLQQLAELQGDYETMKNAYEDALADAEWIPCSERLPDIKEHHVSDPCLVYCENGAYGFAELEENIFGQVGWNCEREDEYHEPLGEVLAWMPLPKPYKGGDNE